MGGGHLSVNNKLTIQLTCSKSRTIIRVDAFHNDLSTISIFFGNIFSWGKKQLMLAKRPGINVKLHLSTFIPREE